MKIGRKTIYYSLFMIIALSLSSCASTERQKTESTNTKTDVLEEWKDKLPKDMPERLELELKSDNIKIDGFLEVSRELSAWKTEELILKRHLFNETECLNDLLELLGEPNVLNREKKTKEETLEDGTPLKVDHADIEDNAMAQARNVYFLADFPKKTLINNISNDFILEWTGCFDNVEKNKELVFGSYKDICMEIKNFLEKQKIENVLKPVIYSFSPKLLQNVADSLYQDYMAAGSEDYAKDYQISLGEEDGVYLIRYMQGHKGVPYSYLPLVEENVDGNGVVSGTYMCVLCGKQGIQSVSGRGFYDIIKVEEEKNILSLYDILNKISVYFDSNENNKVIIKEIGLCYLPVIRDPAKLEFTGVPVWYVVYGEGIGAKTGTAREIITFDARTGEIYG